MGNLRAVISADTSGFKKSVEDAKRVLENYTDSLNAAIKINRVANGVTEELVNSYKRVITQLNKVGSGTMTLAQQEKALKNLLNELKAQWANLNDTAKRSDFGLALSNSARTAENQLKTLRTQIQQVTDTTNTANTTLNNFGGVLDKLGGTIGKVALGYGAFKTAQEIFDRCIQSNQTSADNFDVAMNVLNTSVNNFFNAISTGDFSKFDRGILNMIQRAKEAQQALDQLGNSTMSLSIRQVKLQDKISNAKAVLYDPKATKEEKQKAKQDLKQAYNELTESVDVVVDDYKDAIVKSVKGAANIDLVPEDMSIIEKWLEVDATKGRQAAKDWATSQYKEYENAVKQLQYQTGQVATATDIYNTSVSGTRKSKQDDDAFSKGMEKLNAQYKDAIVYNELLNNYSDDQLNNLGLMLIQQISLTSQRNKDLTAIEKIDEKMQNLGNGGNKNTNIELTAKWKEHSLEVASQQAKDVLLDALTKNDINANIKLVPIEQPLVEALLDEDSYNAAISLNDSVIAGWKKQLEEIKNTKKELEDIAKASEQAHNNMMSGMNGTYSATKTLYESFSTLSDLEKALDGKTVGEQFFIITDQIFNTINAIDLFISGIQSMCEAINMMKAASSAASKAKIAENAAEATSEKTKMGALMGSAASGFFSAHSGIPFVGIAIAIAAIAAMMAVMSQFHNGGIVGKFADGGVIPKFAGGGMLSGATKLGDMNLARVNSGEMILNGTQQKRLFNILNGSGAVGGANLAGNVTFELHGETLKGAITNYDKKMSRF